MKNFLFENIKSTINSIKNFNKNPIYNLIQILPVAMIFIAIIGFIISIVTFSVTGGFSNQISLAKKDLWDGISEGLTFGMYETTSSKIVSSIVLLMLLAEFIVLLVLYTRTEQENKKKIATTCLSIGSIFCILSIMTHQVLFIINRVNFYNLIGNILIIIFVVLMFKSQYKWIVKRDIKIFVIAYIVIPLLSLLIKNIIPIFGGILAILCIFAFIYFGFSFFVSGGEESISNSNSHKNTKVSKSTSHDNKNNKTVKEEVEKPKNEYRAGKNYAYIPDYNAFLGMKLCKRKGALNDYIASDNGMVERKICDLKEFKEGKFHIYDAKTGREIKFHEIPWGK